MPQSTKNKVLIAVVTVLLSHCAYSAQPPAADSLLRIISSNIGFPQCIDAYSALPTVTDSLLRIISSNTELPQCIDAYSQLAYIVADTNSDLALEYVQQALFYCERLHLDTKPYNIISEQIDRYSELKNSAAINKLMDSCGRQLSASAQYKNVSRVYSNAGMAMLTLGIYDYAAVYINMSLKLATRIADTMQMIADNFHLGYCSDQLSSLHKSVEYYTEAERLSFEVHNTELLASIYLNTGFVYNSMNNSKLALEYYFKSLKYAYQRGNRQLLTTLYNNIGDIYMQRGNYQEAFSYMQKALGVASEAEEALVCTSMGELFALTSQYDSATYYLNRGLELYCRNGNKFHQANVYYRLAEVERQKRHYGKAMAYYDSVLSLTKHAPLHQQVYERCAQVYVEQNNYRKAYEYMKLAEQCVDSMLNNAQIESLHTLEQQLEVREKNIVFERNMDDFIQTRQSEREHMRFRWLLISGFIVLLITALAWVILSLHRIRHINKKLNIANITVNNQKKMLEATNAKIEQQYRFLDTLTNNIPTPMFYVDSNFVLKGCNDAFEEACGRERDWLVGRNVADVCKETGFGCGQGGSGMLANMGREHTLQVRYADGKLHDVVCYVSQLTGDVNDNLTSIVLSDITEIENVRRELSESQQKLEAALNTKTRFFSIFAHDLKNPFNGIIGLTNLISEYYDSYSPADILKYVNVINDSATQVYNLLTNLLDWARSQSGILECNPSTFLITEPISESVNINNHLLNSKNINVNMQIDSEFKVFADKNMVLTIFRNLVGNAIKYTPDGGTIRLTARRIEFTGEVVEWGETAPLSLTVDTPT